jgi:hypothetical protein
MKKGYRALKVHEPKGGTFWKKCHFGVFFDHPTIIFVRFFAKCYKMKRNPRNWSNKKN